MKEHVFALDLHVERDAVRSRPPVRLPQFNTMPCRVCAPEELIQTDTLVLRHKFSQTPSRIEQAYKAMHFCMLREKLPVEPAGFVILTIRIVVPALCTSRFVTHEHHRHSHREHSDGQKALDLPISELLHCWVVSGAFNATIP